MGDASLVISVSMLILAPTAVLHLIALVQVLRSTFTEWRVGPAWAAAVLLLPFLGAAAWFLIGDRICDLLGVTRTRPGIGWSQSVPSHTWSPTRRPPF